MCPAPRCFIIITPILPPALFLLLSPPGVAEIENGVVDYKKLTDFDRTWRLISLSSDMGDAAAKDAANLKYMKAGFWVSGCCCWCCWCCCCCCCAWLRVWLGGQACVFCVERSPTHSTSGLTHLFASHTQPPQHHQHQQGGKFLKGLSYFGLAFGGERGAELVYFFCSVVHFWMRSLTTNTKTHTHTHTHTHTQTNPLLAHTLPSAHGFGSIWRLSGSCVRVLQGVTGEGGRGKRGEGKGKLWVACTPHSQTPHISAWRATPQLQGDDGGAGAD